MDAHAMEVLSEAGLQVDVIETDPGPVELLPSADHRVRLHAAAPVRGVCGGQAFVYSRGDLDIVAAGQSDRWIEHDPGVSIVVRLAPALLDRTAQEAGRARGRLQPRHQFRDLRLEHIVWALEAERQAGSPGGRLYRDGLGTALAVRLLGGYALAQPAARGLSPAQSRRVIDYIEAHLDQDLSLRVLAGVAHYSSSHFKTLFKHSLGMPVHEYVMRRRVQRARVLLEQGHMPASQVALAAGFSHQSHMARCMRRLAGRR